MALLVSDEQKDLSSRAGVGLVGNLKPALPEATYLPPGNRWKGKLDGKILDIDYDPNLWIAPGSDAPVFYHRDQPITVRLHTGPVTLPQLKQILGPDFNFSKSFGKVNSDLGLWSIQSYSYLFFGTQKIVDVWTATSGLSLIVVMPARNASGIDDAGGPDVLGRQDVADLAGKIESDTKSPTVKGLSTQDDTARLAALVRPSVVMILNNYCAEIGSAGKAYPFCLAQAGSGFFINKDGFIATNGHVVTNLPETSLFFAVESGSLDNFLTDNLTAKMTELTQAPVDRTQIEQKVREAHSNKETIYQLAALVLDLYKKNLIKIQNSGNHYFVQLSNTPIQLSATGVNLGKDIVPAVFVGADYAPPDPVAGFSTSDVALLKIDGHNYPALPLGSITDVAVGSNVLIVGYPGVVMGSNSILLDTSANAEPTFTRGVVSSFKQAKGNRKNLIQTDASINHGNSGGPAVNSEGKVIGIATYGLIPEEGSGNYNFLRDIADLKDLMSKNNVTGDTGDTYTAWQSGLNNYWLSYFKYAKDDFEKVSGLYPAHPTAAKYLNESTSKTGSVDDRTPKLSRPQRRLYIALSGGAMTLSILMIIILTISNFIDSKRRRAPVILPPRMSPPRPIQTF